MRTPSCRTPLSSLPALALAGVVLAAPTAVASTAALAHLPAATGAAPAAPAPAGSTAASQPATVPAAAATARAARQQAGAPGAEQPAPAKRPMTVDDALDMVSVSGALISPDGAWVLYQRRELNWKDNKYETKTFMVPAAGGPSFQYIGEEGGSDFRFSPDGRYLTFKRRVGKGEEATEQLFWMRTTGGEAVQLTKHATSIGRYEWGHDSARIFFVAEDERPKQEREALKQGDDVIFVDEGPNGQTRDQWSNLWVFTVDDAKESQLTAEKQIVSSFDPSPDGARVALTARRSNRRNDADKTELYLLEIDSGELRRLSDNHAPESGVLWAPDSRRFLYRAADDREWLNRNSKLWVMDAVSGEHRLISGAFPGEISNPVWSPDGAAVLFNGTEGTRANVFRLELASGRVERLTDAAGTLRASSWSADRSRFAYSYSDYRTPTDLWVGSADGAEPVRLTDANPQIRELLLAEMQLVRWRSSDGTEIEGLLHLPPDYEEGTRYPLMLNIHGGPAGVFSNSFRAGYHIYGGLGWVSLSANVRGSCCYDDTLREGNTVARGDGIGMGDYQDLMTGVDALIERGIADPERLALRGWSYGGILGGWTITQTDRFKAASIGAGVYDWTAEYGPGFNNDVRLWHIGGTPWDNPEGYRSRSAYTYVKNVRTATLLIHGMNDTTDTEPQSMSFFTALKDIGRVPVRYLRVPREPHGFREPRHQRRRDIEEIRWMHRYVLGQEWQPWVRQEDKAADSDEADTQGGEQRR